MQPASHAPNFSMMDAYPASPQKNATCVHLAIFSILLGSANPAANSVRSARNLAAACNATKDLH